MFYGFACSLATIPCLCLYQEHSYLYSDQILIEHILAHCKYCYHDKLKSRSTGKPSNLQSKLCQVEASIFLAADKLGFEAQIILEAHFRGQGLVHVWPIHSYYATTSIEDV